MKKIITILGSVRTARSGKAIADWVNQHTEEFIDKCDFEFIDLLEQQLPFLDEPLSPRVSDNYVHEHTREWSKVINGADGFIFITPEYNHGYSPVLKNAIDYLYKEWRGKPVALVGYGGGGARDSIRQLREILLALEMKPLEQQVGISQIWEAFDERGAVKSDHVNGNLDQLIEGLLNEIA